MSDNTQQPTEPQQITVGEISVHAFDSPAGVARYVVRDDASVLPGCGIAINPEKIMRSRKDAELKDTLRAATLRFADGAGVVWAMRRKGVAGVRVPGVDVWEQLMLRAAKLGVPVFLHGARPEVMEQTVTRLHEELPDIIIGASLHGYADAPEVEKFCAELSQAGPAIVALALGSPRQEHLIAKLRQTADQAFFIGVGGTFDCYVGAVERAPEAWQKAGLEWLYRLLNEPSRIRRQWVLFPYAMLTLAGRI